MPSPLGHALAGAAAGWALAGSSDAPRTFRGQIWRQGALFGLLGTLPDIDLLSAAMQHRGPSHSLTAAFIAGVAVAALARHKRIGTAAAAAYATHPILDWLGTDTSAPIGLMVLWPFTAEYYQSNAYLFHAISRRYWLTGFWEQNLWAIVWEIAILLPPAALVLWVRLAHGHSLPKLEEEERRTDA
jgi:hypothetical protein